MAAPAAEPAYNTDSEFEGGGSGAASSHSAPAVLGQWALAYPGGVAHQAAAPADPSQGWYLPSQPFDAFAAHGVMAPTMATAEQVAAAAQQGRGSSGKRPGKVSRDLQKQVDQKADAQSMRELMDVVVQKADASSLAEVKGCLAEMRVLLSQKASWRVVGAAAACCLLLVVVYTSILVPAFAAGHRAQASPDGLEELSALYERLAALEDSAAICAARLANLEAGRTAGYCPRALPGPPIHTEALQKLSLDESSTYLILSVALLAVVWWNVASHRLQSKIDGKLDGKFHWLDERLRSLGACELQASDGAAGPEAGLGETRAAIATKASATCMAALQSAMQEVQAALQTKATADSVAGLEGSLQQVRAELRSKAASDGVASLETELADVRSALLEKADSSSLGAAEAAFREALGGKADEESVALLRSDLAGAASSLLAKADAAALSSLEAALLEALGAKADADALGAAEASLRDALAGKADADGLPSSGELERTRAGLEEVRAALHAKATVDSLSVVRAATEAKADAAAVPTLSAFEQLSATVARKADANSVHSRQDMATMLVAKADAHSVPTQASMRELQNAMANKADSSQVPTLTVFRQLESTVETKADASRVPTLVAFQELMAWVAASSCSATSSCSPHMFGTRFPPPVSASEAGQNTERNARKLLQCAQLRVYPEARLSDGHHGVLPLINHLMVMV